MFSFFRWNLDCFICWQWGYRVTAVHLDPSDLYVWGIFPVMNGTRFRCLTDMVTGRAVPIVADSTYSIEVEPYDA